MNILYLIVVTIGEPICREAPELLKYSTDAPRRREAHGGEVTTAGGWASLCRRLPIVLAVNVTRISRVTSHGLVDRSGRLVGQEQETGRTGAGDW